jgi:hypothetical protein
MLGFHTAYREFMISDGLCADKPTSAQQESVIGLRRFVCRPDFLLAGLVTLTAVSFHVVFLLHAGGFWRDEVNTINVASRHSLGEMANDSFPILMPLVVRGWLALGSGHSDESLRCLGTLVGLCLLAALWLAAWTGRREAPVLSLALFGLNTTAIIYGDSLRPWGIGSLVVVLLLAAMCAFLRKPSWGRTGLLGSAGILSVQALFQNGIFVASICLGGWIVCWRRRMWPEMAKILLVALLAAASLAPYRSRIEPLAKSSPTSGISTLRTEFRPSIALANLNQTLGFPLDKYVWVWGLLTVAVVGFAAYRWHTGPAETEVDHGDADVRLLAATALLTSLGGFAIFLWWAALRTQPWYFLPPAALMAACFEVGMPAGRRFFYGALVFGAITALLALPFTWRGVHWRFTNVDMVAKQLSAQAAAEDYILVTPWNRGISFARYFSAKTSWDTIPPLEDHSTHRYDLLQRQTQTSGVMAPILERMAATLQAGHRVWVVGEIEPPALHAAVPEDLGPPPLEHTGWSAGPYVRRWTFQAAQFLRNHTRDFSEDPMPDAGNINSNETLELWVAEKWQILNSNARRQSN